MKAALLPKYTLVTIQPCKTSRAGTAMCGTCQLVAGTPVLTRRIATWILSWKRRNINSLIRSANSLTVFYDTQVL